MIFLLSLFQTKLHKSFNRKVLQRRWCYKKTKVCRNSSKNWAKWFFRHFLQRWNGENNSKRINRAWRHHYRRGFGKVRVSLFSYFAFMVFSKIPLTSFSWKVQIFVSRLLLSPREVCRDYFLHKKVDFSSSKVQKNSTTTYHIKLLFNNWIIHQHFAMQKDACISGFQGIMDLVWHFSISN